MTKALIVVDVQNDFISGSLAVPGGEQVAQRIAYQLLPHTGDLVVTTQDWHVNPRDHFTQWPVHCKAYTKGAALHDALKDILVDAHFFKGEYSDGYSGFEGHKQGRNDVLLVEWLRAHDVTEVDLVGLALDHCVRATALDAIKAGFEARVLMPYVAAVEPERTEEVLAELEAVGVTVVRAATL